MKNKQLIIFDMDGTLIDSGDVISNTINYVRTNLGLKSMPKEELLSNLNNPDINTASFFYGTEFFTDKQTKLFGEYYDINCTKDISLYDGIKELLHELDEHFIFTIATNASSEFAVKMLKHLQIDHYFQYVIGSYDVTNPKPDPEMLLKTIKKLQIDIENSILIGDSNKDRNAAKACAMDFILVNWGFSKHSNTDAISNVKDLHQKLLKLI